MEQPVIFQLDEHKSLITTTFGVGNKTKLAIETGIYDSIGVDLVAGCVNHLICSGARPLFFVDHYTAGKFHHQISAQIITGIKKGCHEGNLCFMGGSSSKVHGRFHNGDYELVGFSVGELFKEEQIDGVRLDQRDTIIGISSNGFHDLGFELIRKVLDKEPNLEYRNKLKVECLAPTQIYVDVINQVKLDLGRSLKGLADITHSGLYDVEKMSDRFDFELTFLPPPNDLPPHMVEILERVGLNKQDLCYHFNMGIGMILVTDQPDVAMAGLAKINQRAWVLGQVTAGNGKVRIR